MADEGDGFWDFAGGLTLWWQTKKRREMTEFWQLKHFVTPKLSP
jgi:hypothetical protein